MARNGNGPSDSRRRSRSTVGRSIDFLRWIEAQTGRTLVFADAASEQAARDTMLSGTVELEPLLKLAAVIATTDLDYSLEGERIVIRADK